MDRMSRTNYMANILLFVPVDLGPGGALLLGRRKPLCTWRPWLAVRILPVSAAPDANAAALFHDELEGRLRRILHDGDPGGEPDTTSSDESRANA